MQQSPLKQIAKILAVSAALITGLGAFSPPDNFVYKGTFVPSYNQELVLKNRVNGLPRAWAYAIGPYGRGAGWGYRASTIKLARRSALNACRRSLRGKKIRKLGCRIIATSNSRHIKIKTFGPAVGASLPLPDKPYELGLKRHLPGGKEVKGVLLMLHGCKGRYNAPVIRSFAAYLAKFNFVSVSPNSYNDKRPPSLCGKTPISKAGQRDRINRIRQAQTRRTILLLQKNTQKFRFMSGAIQKVDWSPNGYLAVLPALSQPATAA